LSSVIQKLFDVNTVETQGDEAIFMDTEDVGNYIQRESERLSKRCKLLIEEEGIKK
jgi:hypothetical protein